jgi:hypothetical protein
MQLRAMAVIRQMFLTRRMGLLAIVLVFVALSIASAVTRAPWCDEAYFAEPAYQILKIGRMATLVTPPSPIDDPRTFGTDRFIYWTLPLDIVLQAGWYKLVGFGMIPMRLLSLLWGLVALGAWWTILTKIGANQYQRLTALALIAVDYAFVRSASEGRMDMMAAALGFLGIAIFLSCETSNYSKGVFWGAACTAASALTHPVGGVLATAGLGVAILWYSRHRFGLKHVGLAIVPYLFFFGAWGIYIAQAPDVFRRQLLSISGGRLSAWKTPMSSIAAEFMQRWAKPFGLVGPLGLRQVRAIVLVAICCGLIWAILHFRGLIRQGFGLVVTVAVLDLALLCFGDATKNAAYLVHVLPWLYVCLAVLLVRYLSRGGALVFCVLILIQIFGTVYTASRWEYVREFEPVIAVIRQHGGQVTGEGELGFGLGFGPWLIDDRRLGFYSKLPTELFVVTNGYEAFFKRYATEHPEIDAYITAKLARSRLIYKNSSYRVYQDPAVRN